MEEIRGWDFSILNEEENILYENYDYETEEDAEDAAMAYIEENGITDYMLDVSQPDC